MWDHSRLLGCKWERVNECFLGKERKRERERGSERETERETERGV